MITVTLREIIDGIETMKSLMNEPLPSRVAFQVAKLAQNMATEYKCFEDTRLKLIQEYGEKDENGELLIDSNNQYKISSNRVQEFSKEIEDLMSSNVELVNSQINIDDLNCDLTPNEMINLMPFLEENNEEEI